MGGRDDCPVSAMWRALVTRVVLQNDTDASFLRELDRNPALLSLCGFAALGRQSAPAVRLERTADGLRQVRVPSPRRNGAPTPAAFSRFGSAVVALECRGRALSGLVDALRGTLMSEQPDYGRSVGAGAHCEHQTRTARGLLGGAGVRLGAKGATGSSARTRAMTRPTSRLGCGGGLRLGVRRTGAVQPKGGRGSARLRRRETPPQTALDSAKVSNLGFLPAHHLNMVSFLLGQVSVALHP